MSLIFSLIIPTVFGFIGGVLAGYLIGYDKADRDNNDGHSTRSPWV